MVMLNKKMPFFEVTYIEHLKIINGVKLTNREIDIIAFFVCGRSAKKIASFFSISPKTVENHTHNIMLKFGCNSRESIIDFVEKSNKLPILRKYYTAILLHSHFDNCLKNISKHINERKISCALVFQQEQNAVTPLILQLEKSLLLAGINVLVISPNEIQSLDKNVPRIYIVLKEHVSDEENSGTPGDHLLQIRLSSPGREKTLYILGNDEEFENLKRIDQKVFYQSMLVILKCIIQKPVSEEINTHLDEINKIVENLSSKDTSFAIMDNKTEERKSSFNEQFISFFWKRKWVATGTLSIFLVALFGLFEFSKDILPQSLFKNLKSELQRTVRSDLNIPIESVRLDRPELEKLLDDKFLGWKGIQTVALVGVEGSGKTTLARHYAAAQDSPNVWEINAETKETLYESFESLAQAVSKTEEDQKHFSEILKTKNFGNREQRLLQFVKEKLKYAQNWFLIFDNVESWAPLLTSRHDVNI